MSASVWVLYISTGQRDDNDTRPFAYCTEQEAITAIKLWDEWRRKVNSRPLHGDKFLPRKAWLAQNPFPFEIAADLVSPFSAMDSDAIVGAVEVPAWTPPNSKL